MAAPLVSVIIACRNEARSLPRLLDSLRNQQPPGGGMEVIIADGMSDDQTREILRGAPKGELMLTVIDNPGRIASTGLNACIRASRGSIILRMDAHTEYAPDYVRRCVEVLDRTGADNVGGPARTKPIACMERAIAAAYHSPFSVGGAKFHDVAYEGYVDTVTYGCWRRASFDRFGFFDEELARNQDDEHNLRIIRGGGKVWQSPAIQSWYQPRRSLSALFKQYMQYGYWKVRVIQKHKLPASWRHLVPSAFLGGLVLLVLAGLAWHVAWRAAAGLLALYTLGVLGASFLTAARNGWPLLPALPLVFPCYHFGYGYGFLRGILDFAVLGRRPGTKFNTLTR
ncbi:MAG TPA: glycosyltransferase family 2 protein [Verrucomicrobiae bacterium]